MTSSSPRIFAPSSLQIQATNNDHNPSSLSTSRDKDPHSSVIIPPIQTDSVIERHTGFWLSLFVIIFSFIYLVGIIIYAKMNNIHIPSPFDFFE